MLDYINKDPIFSDSKYELYGDFETPFYHFSKGLGFDEIYKLHEKGAFDEYGRIQFSRNHVYTLPPYLKQKLGYDTDPRFYPQSVKDWSELHGFNNFEAAQENRNIVVERSLIAAQIARGKPKLDLGKAEKNEAIDRANRFNGFTDYEVLDQKINFVV